MPADQLDHYTLERSTDGVNWVPITPPAVNETQYIDSAPISGDLYYHLKGFTQQNVEIDYNIVRVTSTQPGHTNWGRDMTGLFQLYSFCVDTDSSGNVAVGGNYNTGTASALVDFGGGPVPGSSPLKGFVARYTSANVLSWAKVFGAAGTSCNGIACDSSGSIIAVGSFAGSVTFGNQTFTNVGTYDGFIVKYASDGTVAWAKHFYNSGFTFFHAVAVDASGNVYAAGRYNFETDFEAETLPTYGSYDIVLLKLDGSNGNVLWAKHYGSTSGDIPKGLATIDNDVLLVGNIAGAANLGNGTVGQAGSFIGRYAGSDGSYVWANTSTARSANAVAVQASTGRIYMGGSFLGSVDLGGGSLTTNDGGGMYIVGFNSAGTWLWNAAYGGTTGGSLDGITGLSINTGNKLAITGSSYASLLDFGGGLVFGGAYFIACFEIASNNSLTWKWNKRAYASGVAISFDNLGHVVTTCTISYGTVDFGDGVSVDGRGNTDGVVIQYAE